MRKFFLSFFLAGIILTTPISVLAQTGAQSEIPELNPLCWKKEECVEARKKVNTNWIDDEIGNKEAESGWVKGAEPCDKDDLWGKCLPVGQTVTSISFGGKKEFENIGDFIPTIYNYGVGVAGILAVLMIIFAGGQWVASGGNSEMITSAKKRIGGAIIGLAIAYFSYVILNTINPALVNLRLPQVYMIKSQSLMPEYCSELPTSTKFALVGPSNTDMKTFDFSTLGEFKNFWDIGNKKWLQELACNQKFAVADSKQQVCQGSSCQIDNNICVPAANKGKNVFECVLGTIYGKITYNRNAIVDAVSGRGALGWTHMVGNGWEDGDPVDITATELVALCKSDSSVSWWQQVDSVTREVSGGSEAISGYVLSTTKENIDDAVKDCGGDEKLRGFVLMLEMDEFGDPIDEVHFVGLDNGKVHDFGRPTKENVTDSVKQYFIPKDRLVSGVGLKIDIEASDIEDID